MTHDPNEALTEDERAKDPRWLSRRGCARLGRARAARPRGVGARADLGLAGALEGYRTAERPLDALRVAVESGAAAHLDLALHDIEATGDAEVVDAAIRLLQRRRRSMEAARLLALRDDPRARARALVRAGDRLGAARVLAADDHPREALDVLTAEGDLHQPDALALAAGLSWDLGNAEGAARLAQHALRNGGDEDETRDLLARALGALGHDLAAQMVVREREVDVGEEAVPGRYRITALGPSGLVGAAYVGFDRVTLQEVENPPLARRATRRRPGRPAGRGGSRTLRHLRGAAAQLGEPSIRPIVRLDPRAGLLVLPQAAGPSLRTLIRPPGMLRMASRARALVAFMLEGLAAAHRRGLVHGWLLPSHIMSDAAGRPLLGTFGAHHLSGLAATHTGGLEEIMMITAPELRSGAEPTAESDLYAVGSILRALLTGRLSGAAPEDAESPELELVRELTATDPEARPDVRTALRILRAPVADVRELEGGLAEETAGKSTSEGKTSALEVGVVVSAAESWSDDLLDALCRCAAPWLPADPGSRGTNADPRRVARAVPHPRRRRRRPLAAAARSGRARAR